MNLCVYSTTACLLRVRIIIDEKTVTISDQPIATVGNIRPILVELNDLIVGQNPEQKGSSLQCLISANRAPRN